MSTYAEKLKDPRWQKKRLEVMQRDNFECRDCGDKKKTLHVHHCFYEKGDPWDTDSVFLLTLCSKCHERRQPVENEAKLCLGLLLARLKSKGDRRNSHRHFVQSLINMANAEVIRRPEVVEHEDLQQTVISSLERAASDLMGCTMIVMPADDNEEEKG